MLKQIHPNLLRAYINFGQKDKIDLKEAFTSLSVEMGGDGQKISKDQLDSYIKRAENGTIKVGKTKLRALKMFQQNWNEIAKDKDSIVYGDLKDFSALLSMTTIDDYSDEDDKNKKDKNEDKDFKKNRIQDYIKELAEKANKTEFSKEDFSNKLKSVIADFSNEAENVDEIDILTNIIADFDKFASSNSTISANTSFESKDIEA